MEIKAINTERSTSEIMAKCIVAKEARKPSKTATEIFKRPAYQVKKKPQDSN